MFRRFSVAIFIKDRQYWSSHALSLQINSATVSFVMFGLFFTWLHQGNPTECKGYRIGTWNRVQGDAWVPFSFQDFNESHSRMDPFDSSDPMLLAGCIFANIVLSSLLNIIYF